MGGRPLTSGGFFSVKGQIVTNQRGREKSRNVLHPGDVGREQLRRKEDNVRLGCCYAVFALSCI